MMSDPIPEPLLLGGSEVFGGKMDGEGLLISGRALRNKYTWEARLLIAIYGCTRRYVGILVPHI